MTATDTEIPDFREWADDPANAEAMDELVAHFIADDGVEMVSDLVAARGPQHQWAAERWVDRLAERFRQWWAQGRPRLRSTPRLTIIHWAAPQEEEARRVLASNLPPGATFTVARAWRRAAGGDAEPQAWVCRIEDGAARAMAQGATPRAAADKALDAWREYVTSSRFEGVLDAKESDPAGVGVASDSDVASKPPLLDAPSAHPDERGQGEREAV
jgi:hypothetical protein